MNNKVGKLFDLNFYIGDPHGCSKELCININEGVKGITVLPTSMNDIYWQNRDSKFKKILNKFDYLVPDGMPLVWLLKNKNIQNVSRIYGPDLMLNVCKESVRYGLKHYLLGGYNELLDDLKSKFEEDYDGINIVGSYAPPFRPLNKNEEISIINDIEKSKPDIIWIGLGSPKQVYFVNKWKNIFPKISFFAVGASFDFNSGRKPQAPKFMQSNGLEWLFRLLTEPKRLYKRYIFQMPMMIWLFVRESIKG